MDILKAFKINTDEFHVNIQGTHDDPLFQANQIAKILEIKNIRDAIKDFNEDERGVGSTDTNNKGKRNSNFITEKGLYRLIAQSRKPIAKTFQSWMTDVIKEIRLTGMYRLKQENEVDKQLLKNKHKKEIHQMFLEKYKHKNVVYIIQLEDENYEKENKILIKIGNTQNIKERFSHLHNDFDHIKYIIDIYECVNHVKFERFLHNHPNIEKYRKSMKTKNDIESQEIYLIHNEYLSEIKDIIKNKIDHFNDSSILNQELQLKIQESHLKILEKENEMKKSYQEFTQKMSEMQLELQKIKQEKDETQKIYQKEVNEKSGNNDLLLLEAYEKEYNNNYILNYNKKNNGIRTPKVYKYHPDDLENHIEEFDCPKEALNKHNYLSMSALKRAVKGNHIYKNYRWIFHKRDEQFPKKIPNTIPCKHQSPQIKFIAMIDIKQTKIIDVFATQKEACEARNLKSRSFTRAIQQKSISSGHYWNYFDDCSDTMKIEYLKHNKLPEKTITKGSLSIQQINPYDNSIINTFHSKTDVIKKFQMSYFTLDKALKENKIIHGYFWKKNNV